MLYLYDKILLYVKYLLVVQVVAYFCSLVIKGVNQMSNIEFNVLISKDVSMMSDLLCKRQTKQGEYFPFLNNDFLNKQSLEDHLTTLFLKHNIIGIKATHLGQLVGYIFGEVIISNRIGRAIWVPYEGMAILEDQPSKLLRILYSKVSDLWIKHGCFNHNFLIPMATNVYYEAFVNLSFAIEQVYGVMDVHAYQPFKESEDVSIRIANKKDREVLKNMSSILSHYQNLSPVYIPAFPEVIENIKHAFERLVDEEDVLVLLAQTDNQDCGFLEYEKIEPSLMNPDNSIELCTAGVLDSYMSKGVGKKLMNEGNEIIKKMGYNYIVTDWRITNLASSSFWPKCGFNPIAYKMVRQIDPNNAWANFDNPRIHVKTFG